MSSSQVSQPLDLHVMVFAGPNGSGKTSVIEEIKQTGLATVHGVYPVPARFINPDQVAKDLRGNFADQNARDEAAQAAAMQARAEAIASKLPFAFETVMSHPSRINETITCVSLNAIWRFQAITIISRWRRHTFIRNGSRCRPRALQRGICAPGSCRLP